jgi:hypothetical protein
VHSGQTVIFSIDAISLPQNGHLPAFGEIAAQSIHTKSIGAPFSTFGSTEAQERNSTTQTNRGINFLIPSPPQHPGETMWKYILSVSIESTTICGE